MPPTTFKLRLDAAKLEQWRAMAEHLGYGLSEWIRAQCEKGLVIKHGTANDKDSPRVPRVRANRRGSVAARGSGRENVAMGTTDSISTHSESVRQQPNRLAEPESVLVANAKPLGSEIERQVAQRVGHKLGCECFNCAQTLRFLKAQQASEKKGGRR